MKNKILVLVLTICTLNAKADEGMWLINLIHQNIPAMQSMGFKLTAEDIYSINKSSLKDAVVQFDDGGCTGELVSAEGLFFTNHHCGVDAVQSQSTTTHNLLKDGFWSKNKQEEIPIEGKTALILVSVEDVTSQVLSKVSTALPNAEYFEQIDLAAQNLLDETKKNTDNFVVIKPFYDYNAFYMFQYERYLDVRLVGVPPSSIGNFGGDIDNWHWPRHTGDFCIFRIYTDANGKPAEYSTSNVPYKSKNFLKISLNGIEEGDFSMIIGYPGTTHRYASSFEALHNRDVIAPWKRSVWGAEIGIIKRAQAEDPAVKVDYTDKHDYLVNFYQKDTWQAESMFRYNVVERLAARQDSLKDWANQSPSQRSRYITSIPVMKNYYDTYRNSRWEQIHGSLSTVSFYPVDVYKNVNRCEKLLNAVLEQGEMYSPLKFWKKDRIRSEAKQLKKEIPDIFKNYHMKPDMGLYMVAFGDLLQNTGDCPRAPLFNALKHQQNIEQTFPYYIEDFYKKSYFTSPENLNRLIANPHRDSLAKDPLFILYFNYQILWDSISKQFSNAEVDFKKASQLFTKGLLEMQPDKLHYPDANSTMRVNYGKVIGYKPLDGLYYKPFTTLDGVMEKVNPAEDVFNIDIRLYDLWKNTDYGKYGKNGTMPVCFLTDNDITGGNSGSPVLNSNGNLIGLAFDGNSEAMACDFMFEPEIQRTIVVDIRYVMFVIDKFANAQNLIDEIQIAQE